MEIDMNGYKKFIAAAAAAALLGLPSAYADAEPEEEPELFDSIGQTLCEKAGLAADISANKVIKLDGQQYKPEATLTDNYQVFNLGDRIAVFSSPANKLYKITANTLRGCELNWTSLSGMTNQTSTGYSLYGLLPDKTSNGDAEMIRGSWLKAQKGSEVIEIPIVDTVDLAYYPGGSSGEAAVSAAGAEFDPNAADAPLKAYDDEAAVFTVAAGAELSQKVYTPVSTLAELNTPMTNITAAFSVCVTGDASACVYYSESDRILFRLNADGSAEYPADYSYSDTNLKKKENAAAPGKWHTVGITADYAGNRFFIWLDGELLTSNGWLTTGGTNPHFDDIKLGVSAGKYTLGGKAAYDNLKISRGYFPAADHALTEENSDKLTFSGGTAVYDYNIEDTEELKGVLAAQTGAGAVRLFKSEDKREEAETVEEAKIAEVSSAGGITQNTYALEMKDPLSSEVSFYTEDGRTAGIGKVVNGKTNASYPVVMIMVMKNEKGVIERVYAAAPAEVSGTEYIQTELVPLNGCTPEVFFIDTWQTQRLLFGRIFAEQNE